MKYKKNIIKLRKKGNSYKEIKNILGCSLSTVAFHCKNLNLTTPINGQKAPIRITDKTKKEINKYYKTHSVIETAKHFNISYSSVVNYTENKRIIYTTEEQRRNNYLRVLERRRELKRMAVEYKGGKCMKCGYNKCINALDFHHRNPNEKEFRIGSMGTISWEKLKKEIDKCDLVCSNCHREIHYEEKTMV